MVRWRRQSLEYRGTLSGTALLYERTRSSDGQKKHGGLELRLLELVVGGQHEEAGTAGGGR